jgi:phi13 family phage major tail protein
MGKERAVIGVDCVHYALLTSDTVSGATWESAVALPGITEVGINPNGSVVSLFADNGPAITANTIGEIDVTLTLADLTPAEKAVLLGHDTNGGVISYKGDDVSPDVAIGFRTLLSDGSYGYVWLMKGKFAEGGEATTTKGAELSFQTPTISGKFTILAYNGEWKRTTRTDDPDYVAATGTNWFTNGPLGVSDNTPPTATTEPGDADIAVAVDANVVATFNEAIRVSDITAANFILMEADGTVVSGTLTYDNDHKVITFKPTANLTPSTDYIFIVSTNVKDLAGNALATPVVVNFTTTA